MRGQTSLFQGGVGGRTATTRREGNEKRAWKNGDQILGNLNFIYSWDTFNALIINNYKQSTLPERTFETTLGLDLFILSINHALFIF